jgi:signal transduction histidine kinase
VTYSLPTYLFLAASSQNAHANDLFVILPIGILLAVGIVAFAFWAMHLARTQTARAHDLSLNLERLREESRRRLHFLNAISHDLRTPLNGMTLQTHVIEHAVLSHDGTAIHQAIDDIRASSSLAAKILDSLLQYARTEVEQNTLSQVPLKELIHQTADPFRAAAEEKLLIFSLHVPENIILETDREKLERILANLLDNAIKFTPHGSIAASATTAPGIPPFGSPRLSIEVTDTGHGVLPEHQEKLFHEFFQANNPSRDARLGLGLGLVIARRLTEQLGGTLCCKSEPNKGSTFTVELPMQSDRANRKSAATRTPDSLLSSGAASYSR